MTKTPQGYILQGIVEQSGLSLNGFAQRLNIEDSSLINYLNSIRLSADFTKKVDAIFGQSDWERLLPAQYSNINIQGDYCCMCRYISRDNARRGAKPFCQN